jgi:hypothetical protein
VIIYNLLQLLTNYYEAYIEHYADLYNPYDEVDWIRKIGIITRVKDMITHFANNLTIDILKDFERDIENQLKNTDVDLDDAYRLVCKTRDEAIEKFEKLERGLYNIHHTAFRLT